MARIDWKGDESDGRGGEKRKSGGREGKNTH